MSKLSQKQQEIYDYILSFAQENGYPPSVREIAQHVGLKSPSTVHFHLKGLREAGLISQAEGKTRAITITDGCHNRRDQVPVVGSVAAGSPIYEKRGLEKKNLMRALGVGCTAMAVLVPWSLSTTVAVPFLGVEPMQLVPYNFFLFVAPVVLIVWTIIGKDTKWVSEVEEKKKAKEAVKKDS